MTYTADFVNALSEIDADVWDGIALNETPFIRHAFLNTLETSGCVHAKTGWQPYHLIVKRGEKPVAVLPLYVKGHSFWGVRL